MYKYICVSYHGKSLLIIVMNIINITLTCDQTVSSHKWIRIIIISVIIIINNHTTNNNNIITNEPWNFVIQEVRMKQEALRITPSPWSSSQFQKGCWPACYDCSHFFLAKSAVCVCVCPMFVLPSVVYANECVP